MTKGRDAFYDDHGGDHEYGISNPNGGWALRLYSTELLPVDVKAMQILRAKVMFYSPSS